MPWIMSSRAHHDPRTFEYFIGNVPIVKFTFTSYRNRWVVQAVWPDTIIYYESMSLAMKAMHERLNSPSPEGAEVSAFEKKKEVVSGNQDHRT